MHPCAHMCVRACVCVFICLGTRACGRTLGQARSWKISDRFPCLFFPPVWSCVGCLCKRVVRRVSICPSSFIYVCVCVFVRVFVRISASCVRSCTCPLLPMPCAISRQHFIRAERPDYVPRPAGSVSPRRISRFGQQHFAPAPQTLSLQRQPVLSLHQRRGTLCAQPVCSHSR